MEHAQAQYTRTAAATEYLGLIISVHKTKYMTINCNPQPPLEVYGQPISHVSNFDYLGSVMVSSISDLIRRKALAWPALLKLKRLKKLINLHSYQSQTLKGIL